MADSVATHVLCNSEKHYVVHLVNASDGTGESAVVKADKSTLLASDGAEPGSLDICQIRWSIQGFSRVLLYWDHTTDDLAMALCGSGYEDFTQLIKDTRLGGGGPLNDPRSSGGTGDVLLTAPSGATTGSYDITIWFHKNPD